ncbi:Uncharacterised protein [Paenibacillus thiaminolyticus]|nr:Uncharacterised protein [Paenibacillus thiaminolyticus]
MSHPTRMRGLKSASVGIYVILHESHPTRMRGLKFAVYAD